MKEELQKQLLSMLESAKVGIFRGVDFLQEQAPELVRQILKYEIITNLVGFFVLVLVGVFIICFFVNLGKVKNDEELKYFSIISLLPFALSICYLMDVLKIYIAPKLFLLEYLKSLLG